MTKTHRHLCSLRTITLAAGIVLSGAFAPAGAQSNSGGIFGHGPAGAEVVATSATGSQRHATINGKGRYTLSPLAMGTYSVSLQKDDKTLDTRKNVAITVGRGAQVDFACPNDNCTAE